MIPININWIENLFTFQQGPSVVGSGMPMVVVKYTQDEVTKTIFLLNASWEQFTRESEYSRIPNHQQVLQRLRKF